MIMGGMRSWVVKWVSTRPATTQTFPQKFLASFCQDDSAGAALHEEAADEAGLFISTYYHHHDFSQNKRSVSVAMNN